MDFNLIKETIKKTPSDAKIYLIEKLSDLSGLFFNDGKILFLVFNSQNNKLSSIKTNLLEMETNVYITSIENSNSFESGFYNLLKFTGNNDSEEFISFIELCTLYSKKMSELSFSDFFHTLQELFQLPTEQSFKNALGLYGELKFLEYILKKYSIDLSPFWHISSSNSQYDISLPDFNIEIKTTLNEKIVIIKHEQIFNVHENYLGTVIVENYDSGESLKELSDKILGYVSNISFAIKLKKELHRIKQSDVETMKFNLKSLNLYSANVINPIKIIPDNISELHYKIDLTNEPELDEKSIVSLLSSVKEKLANDN